MFFCFIGFCVYDSDHQILCFLQYVSKYVQAKQVGSVIEHSIVGITTNSNMVRPTVLVNMSAVRRPVE